MLIAAPDHVREIQSPGWRADPFRLFADLRIHLPVARLDWPMRGAGDWLVTRYGDVAAALRHPGLAISRLAVVEPRGHGIANIASPDPNEPLQRTVLTSDGAQYTPLRARMAQATAGLTPAIERCVDAHIARVTSDIRARSHFDLVSDFAQPICEAIWSELMLIDIAAVRRLSLWSATYLEQGFTFGHGPVKTSAREAIAEMRQVLGATLGTNVAEDRLGFLRAVARDFARSAEDELSATNTAVLLTAAMLQSVRHAMVNCLVALIARPSDWRRVREQPSLVPQAIEECLRLDGPSQAVGRVATVELCLAGHAVARGAFLRLAVASANRDEARFPDADRLDIHRAPIRHLAFGHAFHSCAGAGLARLVLRRGLSSLGEAFVQPMIESAGVVRDLESSLRGYVRVPILADRLAGGLL